MGQSHLDTDTDADAYRSERWDNLGWSGLEWVFRDVRYPYPQRLKERIESTFLCACALTRKGGRGGNVLLVSSFSCIFFIKFFDEV